jgi:threonine dehydratase
MSSRAFNRAAGREVWFKCENFQRAGSFKMRGATNKILTLDASGRGRAASPLSRRAITRRPSRSRRAMRARAP